MQEQEYYEYDHEYNYWYNSGNYHSFKSKTQLETFLKLSKKLNQKIKFKEIINQSNKLKETKKCL
jgi:hypothetical protein